jgi:hypothetical protein
MHYDLVVYTDPTQHIIAGYNVSFDAAVIRAAPTRKRMVRYVPAVCLCLLLLWSSTACAPKHSESPVLSEHGYRVSLRVSDTLIWLGPSGPRFPRTAELVVRVQDAQGQPVDGIAVMFSVEPSWTQSVSLTPAEALTRHGEAHTILQPRTTGIIHVMARVDNVVREVAITVSNRSIPDNSS